MAQCINFTWSLFGSRRGNQSLKSGLNKIQRVQKLFYSVKVHMWSLISQHVLILSWSVCESASENRLIEKESMFRVRLHRCCVLTDSEHASHSTLLQEKIQINYTSLFKKLLRFSFWNILLKCTRSRGWLCEKHQLRRLLSWLHLLI